MLAMAVIGWIGFFTMSFVAWTVLQNNELLRARLMQDYQEQSIQRERCAALGHPFQRCHCGASGMGGT